MYPKDVTRYSISWDNVSVTISWDSVSNSGTDLAVKLSEAFLVSISGPNSPPPFAGSP